MSSAFGKVEPISPGAMDRVLSEIDQHAPSGVVNCRATLDRLDGDLELFRDLLNFYFRDVPQLLRELEAAIASDHAVGVGRWAHRLKGLVSNFDAHRATQSASELEQMGLDGRIGGARGVFQRLESELAEVTALLRRFLSETKRR